MQQIKLFFEGNETISDSVRVGNVGSGDLEVIFVPASSNKTEVVINTSVDNRQQLWSDILDKCLLKESLLMDVLINDFGATPGVVSLRVEQALEQIKQGKNPPVCGKFGISFVELSSRERAHYLLDEGSQREVLGADKNITSPWLILQGIVPQSDDGCIVMKGTMNSLNTVVIGIEGAFQGGAIGEVSGAKMAAALDLALQDNQQGKPTQVVLLLETGGVRLQEANLGLAAIADIHSSIVGLREHINVIGVIAGSVGCFGGMSMAAALCSRLIVTQEARLGLNGPAVIEQEAGIEEYDSRNRPFIWSIVGGEQRHASGFTDHFCQDNADEIKQAIIQTQNSDIKIARCEQIEHYLSIFNKINKQAQSTPESVRKYFSEGAA
jgi:malonate decarboxylase beta subunit